MLLLTNITSVSAYAHTHTGTSALLRRIHSVKDSPVFALQCDSHAAVAAAAAPVVSSRRRPVGEAATGEEP